MEDVNLKERSEGVSIDTKWLTISFTICLGGQVFTVGRCDFTREIERCLKTQNSLFNQLWSMNVQKKIMQL